MPKKYDRAYFDKWYRRSASRVSTQAEVRRKVAMAIATAEYFLRRPLHSVLDVGCGEAPWLLHLRALRPRVRYLGLDPSDYVIERFGVERNIRKAAFGELGKIDLDGPFDLVVCADVLHYLPDAEIRPGAEAIARIAGGIAFLELLTAEDDIVGDLEGLIRRPAAWYRALFTAAGLTAIGPYCWLSPALRSTVAELEILENGTRRRRR
ncbi:MAG TPA: class I SAM-dependent methyltransferase [Thermoanaerobaculia bacterium]|nr:class I SAM-dependent methyltransferase [Thermoanaerobaculia bacterium]